MKLVTFAGIHSDRLGAITSAGILDLNDAGAKLGLLIPDSMQTLIEAGPQAWDAARQAIEKLPDETIVGDVKLRAPLPRPVRFRDACLFLEHLEASFKKVGIPFCEEFKRQVIYYNADNVHIFGTDEDVPWPSASNDRDYELEWACVIGKPGVNIPAEAARDHIFGYTIFNDWSARDLQMPFMQGQLGPGAGKDFANSIGPCIVTADEFEDPYSLRMTAAINGELWSDGSTSSMHYSFDDAVRMLSADRPLAPGEIIGSGTVLSGCGFELGRKLSTGDVVELEIEGIGCLRNRVVAAP